MTTWNHHHPPHDHPDFDAYLNTLTDDDLTTMNTTMNTTLTTHNDELNTRNDFRPKTIPEEI